LAGVEEIASGFDGRGDAGESAADGRVFGDEFEEAGDDGGVVKEALVGGGVEGVGLFKADATGEAAGGNEFAAGGDVGGIEVAEEGGSV
jgi:hypothetical protein